MSLFTNPDIPFFKNDGTINAFGIVYYGEPNQDAETNPKSPFLDPQLVTPTSSRQTLTAGGKLQAHLYLKGSYSVIVQDADEVQIDEFLEISAGDDNGQFAFANVANMADGEAVDGKKVSPVLGYKYSTLGRVSENDGGQADYVVTTDAANGYDKIDLGGGLTATILLSGKEINFAALGGVMDSITDNAGAFDAAYSYCAARPYITLQINTDDSASYYNISRDVNFPPRVSMGIPNNVGTFKIKGPSSQKVIVPQRQGTRIDSISAEYLDIVGQYFSVFGSIYARVCTIKGGTGGTFWTEMEMFKGEQFIIDVTDFSINQNTWHNINTWTTADYGIKIVDGGVGGPTHEAHANRFINADYSRTRGIANLTVENQTNFIDGGYAETLTSDNQHVGTWEFRGMNLDMLNLPRVDPLNSLMHPVNTSERTQGGFFSTNEKNLAVGGDWTALDSDGKPPCFGSSGGSTVVADANIPFNFGYKYGRSATTSQYLTVAIPANDNERFTACGIWCGPDLPEVVEVRVDSVSSFYGIDNFYEIKTGYWFFVITGRASLTNEGLLRLYISNGSTREGYLSGVHMTSARHCVMPHRPIVYQSDYVELPGLVKQKGKEAFSSSSSPLTVTVTFPHAFATSPVVVGTPKISSGTLDRLELGVESTTQVTFDVFFTGTLTGEIHWIAED